MKQQANKSFFGLKWLAVLIATLFLFVGTFAHVSTVNAETPQPVDTTKMKIQGAFEQKINFVDGEDYVSYSDREDMLNKIKYYLEHEDERKMIAENGCRKVREEHTYTQRLSEIIGSI